jgi:hypothetical protein
MFLGIVSSIDFCTVGANPVFSLLSPVIQKSPFSILIEYMHLSNLIF